MNAIFRKAGPCDRSAIEELFVEMLGSIYGTENAEGYGSDYLHKFFSGGEDRIFVAEINEKVIAYISVEIKREERHFAYIDDFCVTAEYRCRGLGGELLEHSEHYADNLGMSAILLHVEKSNISARKLYEKRGYTAHRTDGSRLLLVKRLKKNDDR